MIGTVIATTLRIMSNSLANVYQKQLTANQVGAFFINFVMYFGLAICCIPLVLKTNFSALPYSVWTNAILGGLCGAFGNSYLVKALGNGELSILGPINAYKSVVAMVVGIILLHEIPSLIGIFATFLIIWGSYFVFDTQEEGFSFALLRRKDIRYRIYALIFTAIEAVFVKNVILLTDINTSFFFWCFFGMIFTGLLALKSGQIKVAPKFSIIKKLVLIIILMGTMQYSTNYVFSKINVSYGLALFQLSTIVSVFLGWHFFNEGQIRKKLIGSIIMVIGAVMLILWK